jgi:hypothetical protein
MTDGQLLLLLMCADRSKIVQYIRAGEFDDLADICGRIWPQRRCGRCCQTRTQT